MSQNASEQTRVVLNADSSAYAGRIKAKQQHSGTGGDTTSGTLPVWVDRDGKLRIAIQVRDPQFSHDFDQIIIDPAELFLGLATAWERQT